MDITALNEKIRRESEFIDALFNEIGKTIVGQKMMLERLVVGMLG
ncbi:MAG: ATPase, partial [Ignavibacteriae bacterium HGW-Ignavibacteriae-3]